MKTLQELQDMIKVLHIEEERYKSAGDEETAERINTMSVALIWASGFDCEATRKWDSRIAVVLAQIDQALAEHAEVCPGRRPETELES